MTLPERMRNIAGELNQEGFAGCYDGDEAKQIWEAMDALREAADLIERRRLEAIR